MLFDLCALLFDSKVLLRAGLSPCAFPLPIRVHLRTSAVRLSLLIRVASRAFAVYLLRFSRFNEIDEGSQGSTDTVGSDIQLLNRKIQSIDPEGRVPEVLSAYCIPAAKGGKQDLFAR